MSNTHDGADADIIDASTAWCSQWHADQIVATPRPADAIAQSRADLDRIVATRAVTLAGIKSKARVLACLDYGRDDLAASICNDILGLVSV